MKPLATTPKQDEAVARHFDGDTPYSPLEMDDANKMDAVRWLASDDLIALVEEANGGIIGYINRQHADRIVAILNVASLPEGGAK